MTRPSPGWYVDVVRFIKTPEGDATQNADDVERRIGPSATERTAEKVDRGVNINLDHEQFYTRIREVKA